MKLRKLTLSKFRHCENLEIKFGDKFTVISGQNGTGKSSILGWVAQLCDYKGEEKRKNGKFFTEDYRNVFRFCPVNDYKNSYEVQFEIEKEGEIIERKIKTRHVKATKKSPERYRTDIDGRDPAEDFPIVYLGLKRLIPLATEDKIIQTQIALTNAEKNLYSKLSKDILILIDDKIQAESVNSRNKDVLAMQTNAYGHLGNSAGQDNIGQFLSTILSFQELKNKLGDNYTGGVILIDEIDASLYAASQVKLLDNLFKYARDLNLQIIFTTHSLEILEHLESKIGEDTIINHLVTVNGKVQNKLNPSYEYVSNKIRNQISAERISNKKNFICEDKSAEYWIKNLLNGTSIKSKVNVEKGPFSEGELQNMASSNHRLFRNVGYILDGDIKVKFKGKRLPKRTVFLPGNEPPEILLYKFVKSLPDDDGFWDDDNNFTKQTCFSNYQNQSLGTAKKWFVDPTFSKYFGRGYSKLLNRWKFSHGNEVKEFIQNIEKVVSDL